MSKAHPGYKKVVETVEKKEGVSKKTAEKEVGYAKAHASAEAKEKNPRLNNKGGRK